MTVLKYLIACSLLCFSLILTAQTPEKQVKEEKLAQAYYTLEGGKPTKVKLPTQDVAQLLAEDKKFANNIRFAAPIEVDYSLENAGKWTNEGDEKVWTLHIESPNALALACLYDGVNFPVGAKLFMRNEDNTKVLGAFTKENISDKQNLLTGLLYDSKIVLEYRVPQELANQSSLHIFKIYHAYQKENLYSRSDDGTEQATTATGFGTSSTCNININCTAGQKWQEHKKGVARVMMVLQEGMGWCTGSLMNNSNLDSKPYLLTAFHCQDGYTPMYDFWTFDFNYEASACTTPTTEPTYERIKGCTFKAGRRETDFLLLEMSALPSNPYFFGWNRQTDSVAQQTTMIHHPNGDIKKITYDTRSSNSVFNSTIDWRDGNGNVINTSPINSHFRVQFDKGIFEGGSSGSNLLDFNGLLIGQFHGGNKNLTTCVVMDAFYGRISASWDGTSASARLKDWLDPKNTGALALTPKTATSKITISGKVGYGGTISPFVPTTLMKNVKIKVIQQENGITLKDSTVTDAAGSYSIQVFANKTLQIYAEKEGIATDGVSVSDMVEIRKYLLGLQELNAAKLIAADVNNSGSVTALDLVSIQKVLLGLNPTFDKRTWTFPGVQTGTTASTLINYEFNTISQNMNEVNFRGIKAGDVNENADANQ